MNSTTDSNTLYSIIQPCYVSLSNSFPEYSDDLLQHLEPMLAFINGSFNLWQLERSLRENEDHASDIPAAFDMHSFPSVVLPKLTDHCR